ncbi:MAG: response regulator [Verrucomicrobiales bacterium]|nr:response regulator [Verrucomicrobiales bacterium]
MATEQPILVAEDSDDYILLLQYAWKKARTTIPLIHARDGSEAITFLKQARSGSGTQQMPKLVLTDIRMPRVSGFEVLEFLQREADFQQIVAIAWSSFTESEDMSRAYRAGARCYLPKPSTDAGWTALVQRILNYYHLGIAIAQAPNMENGQTRRPGNT